MITEHEVMQAQQAWGDGVVAIGKAHAAGGDFKALAEAHLDRLYAYGHGPVLFKPTRAAQIQFRPAREDALSYFIGGHIAEDIGFALSGWTAVQFENHNMILGQQSALAMGNYVFTARDGTTLRAEYSFGYVKDTDGNLRINLQHSSVPFSG